MDFCSFFRISAYRRLASGATGIEGIEAIFDGRWVIMEPIAPGNHEVCYKGVLLDAAPMGNTDFATDVAYHIRSNSSFD
mgnify:CR=1 FL=1